MYIDYRKYTANDFLADDYFVDSMLYPDAENKMYWKELLDTQQIDVNEFIAAYTMIKKLHDSKPEIPQKRLDLLWDSINKKNKKKSIRAKSTFFLRYVAVACIVVAAAGYFFFQNKPVQESYILQSDNDLAYFTLPDSSKVTLNKHSKLIYFNDFQEKDRRVVLDGEAYFEVAKMDKKKFVVIIDNSQIEVLGTKFNVNASHKDEYIVATLLEGSILFKNGNQQLLMAPNQRLTFHTQSGQIENINKDAFLDTEWKDRIYRYNSIDLYQLAEQLSIRYGVEIIIGKRWHNIKVSGAFFQEQTIEEILTIMQNSVGFKWKINQNQIIIY